jgi:type IV pilus assembly protein PilA
MSHYYERHGVLSVDNAGAGLPPAASISGRYVSSVTVAAGVVTVAFDRPDTSSSLRHQTLVYLPLVTRQAVHWDCSTYSTVPCDSLPPDCRK